MEEEPQEVDNRTRLQAVKELNRKRAEERKNAEASLRAEYAKIKDSPAFQDILEKGRTFQAYHNKIARDAVGMKPAGKSDGGQEKYEEYTLTSEERLAHLDNAGGIEELIAYIERKVES